MGQQIASIRATRAGVLGTLAVLVVAAVCVRLGLWQLDRLEERRALNEAVLARLTAEPVELRAVPRDTTGLLYRRVVVRGEAVGGGSLVVAGRSHRGSPGVHVVTPLRVDGGAVLVNRGWVPSADAATVPEAVVDTAGPLEVTGVVLPFGARRAGAGEAVDARAVGTVAADTFRRRWFGYDPAMAEQYAFPAAPFYVQELPERAPDASAGTGPDAGGPAQAAPSYPLRLPPPELDAGRHLGYAIQWFSFAVVALVGWAVMVSRSGFLQVGER